MILLTLSRGKGEETVRLQLPASPAEIGETFAFLDRISLDTTATAILDVSSNVPVLYRCLYDVDVEDSEQFQKLQKLAERTEALSPAKAAIFSGALDAECVWNLEGALTVADRLDEYMNHRFLISVLTDDFLSHDLRLTAANLRKERDPEKRTEALDAIDTEAVTQRLMELLDIRNKEEQSIGITTAHIIEIKQYLTALELIVDCPIESADPGIEPVEHILFTQPGMRYCQAQALIHSLLKDEQFSALSEYDKTQITGRILEEVRGRMMEDIVLLETMKAADKDHRVFKLQFEAGEFDMVIYDQKENSC